jgi:membrane protease YdiL (CAAX protease family)
LAPRTPSLASKVIGFFALDLILFATFLFPLAALARAQARRTDMPGLPDMGFSRHKGWAANLAVGTAAGIAWAVGLHLLQWRFGGLQVIAIKPVGEWLLPQLIYALIFLQISFQEEFLIRWYTQQHLLRRFPPPIALMLCAAIYVAHHYHHWITSGLSGWTIRLFLLGLMLSISVYRTGSTWFAIGFHTVWNCAVAFLFGFVMEGAAVTRSANPNLNGWIEIGVDACFALGVYLLGRWLAKAPPADGLRLRPLAPYG